MFNRSISIRQANNQRKNSKDKDGDSTEEGTSSEPLATAMHLDNGWGADEGYFSPFNPMDNPADETDAEELRNDADANAEDEDGAVALE